MLFKDAYLAQELPASNLTVDRPFGASIKIFHFNIERTYSRSFVLPSLDYSNFSLIVP